MRKLSALFALSMAVLVAACGDDDEDHITYIYERPEAPDEPDAEPQEPPPPPPMGSRCVTIVDHNDTPLPAENCTFFRDDLRFDPPVAPSGECQEGTLYLREEPGTVELSAICELTKDGGEQIGIIRGTLTVELIEDEEGGEGGAGGGAGAEGQEVEASILELQLSGSLCADNHVLRADGSDNFVTLQEHLGFSDGTQCGSPWFAHADINASRIVDMILDCPEDDDTCDPATGSDYLTIRGDPGWYTDGFAHHLSLLANLGLVPYGTTNTVTIIVRLEDQEIPVPIQIVNDQETDSR